MTLRAGVPHIYMAPHGVTVHDAFPSFPLNPIYVYIISMVGSPLLSPIIAFSYDRSSMSTRCYEDIELGPVFISLDP